MYSPDIGFGGLIQTAHQDLNLVDAVMDALGLWILIIMITWSILLWLSDNDEDIIDIIINIVVK